MAIATYKGFSTINNDFGGSKLTDTDLIKRDLLNHFAIAKGEKLMRGNFGTSLRDLIMDPLTEETKQLIVNEVNEVIKSDPRVRPEAVTLDEYENGLQIEIVLRYSIDNQVENLLVRFDRPDNTAI
jgi:phage baseplate assembly protein W|tara:strand:- start:246 stop:623 length:378 start_codon:yes stop_codon:yes gene_type:complete